MTDNGNQMEYSTKRSVSMYDTEWAVVEAHAKDTGLNNVSAALRVIINEWAQYKARENGVRLSES